MKIIAAWPTVVAVQMDGGHIAYVAGSSVHQNQDPDGDHIELSIPEREELIKFAAAWIDKVKEEF